MDNLSTGILVFRYLETHGPINLTAILRAVPRSAREVKGVIAAGVDAGVYVADERGFSLASHAS